MKFIFFILLASCYTKNTGQVQIRNDSKVSIDSIQVTLNNYQFTMGSITPGRVVSRPFDLDSVKAKHDVWYSFKGFAKGSVIFYHQVFSNDLGYVPPIFIGSINDSMQLTRLLKLE
jgi:hypothetical protein